MCVYVHEEFETISNNSFIIIFFFGFLCWNSINHHYNISHYPHNTNAGIFFLSLYHCICFRFFFSIIVVEKKYHFTNECLFVSKSKSEKKVWEKKKSYNLSSICRLWVFSFYFPYAIFDYLMAMKIKKKLFLFR